jgi:protein O-GlcNAc transferase
MPAPTAADENNLDEWMRRGIRLHTEGQLEQALAAFEHACRLDPENTNAASAAATVLSALARPAAAYRLLLSLAPRLLEDADGAANLAITAETCGDMAQAQQAYTRALQLDPAHLRSLNNLGLMAAAQSQWDLAIGYAEQCVALAPAEVTYHHNLSDFLAGARRYPQALAVLGAAAQRFPEHLDIAVRRVAVLAFDGEFEQSRMLSASLDGAAQDYLRSFLSQALTPTDPERLPRPAPPVSPDPLGLFTGQAFEAMAECDWRSNTKLVHALRESLADSARTGQNRDWRDAQFYGLMLDLQEGELAQMRQVSVKAIAAGLGASLPAFRPGRKTGARSSDTRIHVGLAVPSLRNPRQQLALQRQLVLHDHKRFAIHVYAGTHRPEPAYSDSLRPHAASVMETAHLTDVELAARIRLDQLDVFVDMAFASSACRPEIPALRVAPVQIRQLTWHRHHPPAPCDYNMSDRFIHPDGLDLAPYGPVLRLPHTCWLAVHSDDSGAPGPLWAPDNLQAGALVLCSRFSPATLDPETFSAWMQILHALPEAVLYLPGCKPVAAANLAREAAAAGINATRLVFEHALDPACARTRRPDLFLDPLRFSAAEGLEEALRMGVPALSCAGNTMASRMGGSLLHAAGLPGCVLDSRQAYVDEVVRLGRDTQALLQLREQVGIVAPKSALFDLRSRVRDWESAWAWMTQRSRDGLAPAAFSLPPQPPPAGAAG